MKFTLCYLLITEDCNLSPVMLSCLFFLLLMFIFVFPLMILKYFHFRFFITMNCMLFHIVFISLYQCFVVTYFSTETVIICMYYWKEDNFLTLRVCCHFKFESMAFLTYSVSLFPVAVLVGNLFLSY